MCHIVLGVWFLWPERGSFVPVFEKRGPQTHGSGRLVAEIRAARGFRGCIYVPMVLAMVGQWSGNGW
eukprot:9452170-Lingulodinium_polyedra.AAC.1